MFTLTGRMQQLPGLAECAEGLQETMPLGRGEVYTYPTSGHGDIIVGGENLPSRFGETGIVAFRNKQVHSRYGDRLIVRRLDKLPFGLVKYAPLHFEDVTTRRSRFADLRSNHLALRIDGDVPELPDAPRLHVVDDDGFIEFWGDLLGRLRADFE